MEYVLMYLACCWSSDTTESRKFQVLAHAVARVPSFADVASTRHAALYSDQEHR